LLKSGGDQYYKDKAEQWFNNINLPGLIHQRIFCVSGQNKEQFDEPEDHDSIKLKRLFHNMKINPN
jgi:hypothetical protein